MKKAILALVLAATGAAVAADEEITSTPPALEMKAVTATCETVVKPYRVRVNVLGECDLIGVQKMQDDDPYFGKALKFVKDRVLGQEVRVEVCPNVPQNDEGQNRALIYYEENGKWVNLSIELVRAGLAKVADVPGCHVPTKAWLVYENEARKNRLGLWASVPAPKPMETEKPSLSDFE